MGAEEEQVMDTHSIDNDSIAPDEEERRYLEAARDPDAVVTRFSKGPQRLGLWSVVCIILNRTIGELVLAVFSSDRMLMIFLKAPVSSGLRLRSSVEPRALVSRCCSG